MRNIEYIKGDATSPQAKGPKLIGHICNDLGGWGKGFVLAISKRWSEPEKEYRQWHRERAKNDFELGNIQIIQVSADIYVANMIGQHGVKTGSNGAPIRYNAVDKCLEKLQVEANKIGASVHLPRIGCGLAGGKWSKIETLIQARLSDKNVSTIVYDFE
ncbi:MAG: Appr-1-p processing protein [Crocinitomix sp.]|nr:Appr-1-p processing protein [Crocinitomix sp.]